MHRTDLAVILQEIRHIAARYKERKNFFSSMDIQDLRDDLSVLNLQLGDYAAEFLLADRLDTEATRRTRQLEIRQAAEERLKAEKAPYAMDKARYESERLTADLVKDENTSKRIYMHAEVMYKFTIPKLLDSMASRIGVLVRHKIDDVVRTGQDIGAEGGGDRFETLFGDTLASQVETQAEELENLENE